MCYYEVGIMQYLKHNLSKCAAIVQLTLQLLLHRVAMFLQHLTGFVHYFCRFGKQDLSKIVIPLPTPFPRYLRALFYC